MKGITTTFFVLLVALFVGLYPTAATAACDENLPAPVAELVGTAQDIDADGNALVTYVLSVTNWNSYPAELFENSADLPACGADTHNARTWVDIYDDEDDSLLQNFCDLASPEELTELVFSCPLEDPPVSVYVTLTDRRCGLIWTSELVPVPAQ